VKETNMQDSSQPASAAAAEPDTGDGISVSPNDVILNMRQLNGELIGDLMHRLCVMEAALSKCQAEKADALDRLATANARLARKAS
jgi:hypothetical protein